MKKNLIVATIITVVVGLFVFYPRYETVQVEQRVHFGTTVDQSIYDAADDAGIDINNVDVLESRYQTIEENNLDAGNMKPGTTITVVLKVRK